jgi:hypothetical protein
VLASTLVVEQTSNVAVIVPSVVGGIVICIALVVYYKKVHAESEVMVVNSFRPHGVENAAYTSADDAAPVYLNPSPYLKPEPDDGESGLYANPTEYKPGPALYETAGSPPAVYDMASAYASAGPAGPALYDNARPALYDNEVNVP